MNKYSIIFSSKVKCVVDKDKDLLLSKASIDQLKSFIPDVDTEKNRDLLPVSFSACVVNRGNKNRDIITTDIALDIYKTFINKSINIEHDRKKVIGCILTAGFSEFGTEKPLSVDDVKDTKKPFNITLGGVIWRTVNEEVADLIEEASDPSSENFLSISASWELGCTDFDFVLIPEGSKNAEDGEIVSDPKKIEELKGNLISYGGTGKIGDSVIYKRPSEGVLAMGIGFTVSPAAEVKGVATNPAEDLEDEEENDDSEAHIKNNQNENINKISQDNINNVKDNRINMKITSLKDITNENLKVIEASSITNFVEEEINKINSLYLSEKENKEKLENKHKEEMVQASKSLEDTKAELTEVKNKLEELNKLIAKKQKEEALTVRMSYFDEQYNLDDESRKVIASQIGDLDEEGFSQIKAKYEVLLKNLKKSDTKEAKKTEEIVASTTKEETKAVVDDALDKAKVEPAKVPATPSSEQSTKEKWARAFAPENILVKVR